LPLSVARRFAPALLFLLLLDARPARAAITDEDLYGKPRAPFGYGVEIASRHGRVLGGGIDPFSDSRWLSQLSLSARHQIGGATTGGGASSPSYFVGLGWDYGATEAEARQAQASMSLLRFTIPVEIRIAPFERLALFARLAPGLARTSASVTDASAPAAPFDGVAPEPLAQTQWIPAADASAGASFRFGSFHRRGTSRFGFWITAEGGYGWVAARDLTLTRHGEQQDGRVDEPLRLGRLAPSAPFFRVGLGMSF
jgi:hypothetical protein